MRPLLYAGRAVALFAIAVALASPAGAATAPSNPSTIDRTLAAPSAGSFLHHPANTDAGTGPISTRKCCHPEDSDCPCSCSCDGDCCGGAVCRPTPPSFNGMCCLVCCYTGGSIAADPCWCCNEDDSVDICDGFYACAEICPW